MLDWFGEPLEREAPIFFHEDWQFFCSFCGSESLVKFENKYLCEKHADEVMLEWQE